MRSLKSPQKVPGASEANFSRIYAREVGASARENSWLRPRARLRRRSGAWRLSRAWARVKKPPESRLPSRAEPSLLCSRQRQRRLLKHPLQHGFAGRFRVFLESFLHDNSVRSVVDAGAMGNSWRQPCLEHA